MAFDDRPLHENRTIVLLPWDTDTPAWVTDADGKIENITSTAQWFELLKPRVTVAGLVDLEGEEQEEELLEFLSTSDFAPERMQAQSTSMKRLSTFKEENKKIADKLSKSRKLRVLLGAD